MGAATYDVQQLNALGAISLDEFAGWLHVALAPSRAAMERIQAPLSRGLLVGTATAALSELSAEDCQITSTTTALGI